MKKIRFIPYGYTMRNGRTIIDRQEATVIRGIFEQYINGASLKDIADGLTKQKVPYTEKTVDWNKSRIARIIENERYKGNAEYDAIVDERMYANAVIAKTARKNYQTQDCSEAIQMLRTRVKCEACQTQMVRHISNRYQIKECWICANPQCQCQVRIGDETLLEKITVLMNRIIKNADLMVPVLQQMGEESIPVKRIQDEINQELNRVDYNERIMADKVMDLATQFYNELDPRSTIAGRIARKKVSMMRIQEKFNPAYFREIVSYITLDREGQVKLVTNTETEIRESDGEDGSCKNS